MEDGPVHTGITRRSRGATDGLFQWVEDVSPGSFTTTPKFTGFRGRFWGPICLEMSLCPISFMAWSWTFPETNGTVEVEVRITNRNFTKELEDNTSSAYNEFVNDFTKQVEGHGTPTWGWDLPGGASHGCSKFLRGVLRVRRDGSGGGEHPK